eukprot:1241349-Rhodomonas_salina.2
MGAAVCPRVKTTMESWDWSPLSNTQVNFVNTTATDGNSHWTVHLCSGVYSNLHDYGAFNGGAGSIKFHQPSDTFYMMYENGDRGQGCETDARQSDVYIHCQVPFPSLCTVCTVPGANIAYRVDRAAPPTWRSTTRPVPSNQRRAFALLTTSDALPRCTWLRAAPSVRHPSFLHATVSPSASDPSRTALATGMPNYRQGFDVYDASTGIEEDISKVVIKDGEVMPGWTDEDIPSVAHDRAVIPGSDPISVCCCHNHPELIGVVVFRGRELGCLLPDDG